MTKDPRSIAFYLRVSRKSQEYDSQLEGVRQFCKRQGWPLPGRANLFSEKESGGNTKRGELDRMLQAIREGKFDCIVCWRLDRLGRSHVHTVNVHAELTRSRIRVIGVGDGLDTADDTAALRLFRNILNGVAEFQRDQIRENVHAGLAAAAKRGKFPGRPAVDPAQLEKALASLAANGAKKGLTIRAATEKFGINKSTLQRALAARKAKP